ncbi:MAG TPA: polysaccharide biosynthesis tyrosine autokinase [Pyrinomonadaceae bacterium]|nr:polysaccharide biosynthesis tyrosine autokinase [Pyrinomonadaceae bacterium]
MKDPKFPLKRYLPSDNFLEIPEIDLPVYSQKFEPAYPKYPAVFEHDGENPEQIDIREIWRRMRKHKWLILGVVTIFTTLAALQVSRTKAWYTASTIIEIGKDNTMVIKSEGLTLSDDSDPYYLVNVNTKKLALENPVLFEKVVLDQKLDQNPAVIESLQKKPFYSFLKIPFAKTEPDNAPPPPKTNSVNEDSQRLAPFVELVQKNVKVEQITSTRALKISYTSEDPVLAAGIANSIARTFMQSSFNSQTEKFTNSVEWLDSSTRELKTKVQFAEESLAKYTRENQIYSTNLGDGDSKNATLTTSKLTQLHDQFIRTQNERLLKKSLYEQVQAGRIAELPEAFSDPKITKYQQELADLQKLAAELKVKFGAANPKIIEVQNQIAVLDSEIEKSRKELEAKLNADYERAVEDERSLGLALTTAKLAAVNENQASIKYNILKQDVETARELYTDFLKKTNQANAQVAEQSNNIKVIQPAQVPYTPVGPKRFMIVLGVFIGSLGVGIGLSFFLEYLDDTIKTVEDVERYAQLPMLGIIPAFAKGSSRFFKGKGKKQIDLSEDGSQLGLEHRQNGVQSNLDTHSMAGEAYRALRTSLLLSAAGTPPKTILVTSGQPGEGKSTTAVHIAYSLAQLGAEVLIIDCDLRHPTLHKKLNISSAKGITNYLSSNTSLEPLIQELEIPNLSAIPSGPIPPNPAELLSSRKMKEMIDLLGRSFDHIIIDSPPIASVTDPIILSTLVDGTIMVIQSGKARRGLVQRSCQELSSVRAKIFGVVLNNVNLHREGYRYQYYKYGYGTNENS